MTGSQFALLRPEFSALRSAALRRRENDRVERLLISLGTTDVGSITAQVVREVLNANLDLEIDVVLMPGAPSLDEIQALAGNTPELKLHVDPNNLTSLMAESDIAIGAPGSSAWERCCLALPTLSLILAENQRFIAQQLAAAEAHSVVDPPLHANLVKALRALIDDPARRLRMSQAAAALVDGKGADRVAAALVDGLAGTEST